MAMGSRLEELGRLALLLEATVAQAGWDAQ